MQMEHYILGAMWLFGFGCFFLFIPRQNRREGVLALIMFQGIIWLCDMPSFYYGLISAPVRLLPKATDLAITIDYIFYPVLFSIYYVHQKKYVHKRKKRNWTIFFSWVTIVTVFDILTERYTDLLEYGSLTRYGMVVYIAFLFYVSEVCCNWFYRQNSISQASGG